MADISRVAMSKNISETLNSINVEKPIISTLAKNGHENLVQKFLTENLTLNGSKEDTQSQLYMACFWGIYEAVRILISNGADINYQNPGSLWSPLHAASFQEHGKVVMLLLDEKANPLIEDSEGRAPVDFASVSDKIWPLFAACGCKRTPKSQLVQKGVLKQPLSPPPTYKDNFQTDMNKVRNETSTLPINYSSPETHQQQNDRNAYAAAIDGDVLAGDAVSNAEINKDIPNFNAWRN